ncbi:protein tyrosine phosphatase [Cyclospora cayetanensis]|uniref:protein-tyrosine-phosphatase n=1 Tax=Cyclospora cayetanensis TaxID=88456 RepID=A0A1D3DAH1_9EIME|nr:protein tyrosine phosphatase [Cyclospora cayetanensis]
MVRSVLFVCLGNVNRSPTAEYIFRAKLNLPKAPGGSQGPLYVASAATGGHTEGDPAMREMIAAARKRGIDLTPHRARQRSSLTPPTENTQQGQFALAKLLRVLGGLSWAGADFETFDLIVAMDRSNLRNLSSMCPPQQKHKLKLLIRDYAPQCGTEEVPDPYYEGGHLGVFDLIEKGIEGLIEKEGISA